MKAVNLSRRYSALAGMLLINILSIPVLAQRRKTCVFFPNGNLAWCHDLLKYNQTTKDFVFEFHKCSRIGENIKCYLTTTTSERTNKTISVFESNLTSSFGLSYKASKVKFGDTGMNSSIHNSLVLPGVKYETILTFENVPEDKNQFLQLNMIVSGGNKVVFFNILLI
jgi:hypothetical protein